MSPNDASFQTTYYYGVVYFDNGEASISKGFISKEDCIEAIKKGVMKHPQRVVATSYITRKVDSNDLIPTTQQLFGCPDSRNIMKDKKFIKEISL